MSQAVRTRIVSPEGKVASLSQLRKDGKACAALIRRNEETISVTSRDTLRAWFDQAHRLKLAREVHGLRGAEFLRFAQDIGIKGNRAYEIERLDGYRDVVFSRCLELESETLANGIDFRWPGWKRALEIALPHREAKSISVRGFIPNRPPRHEGSGRSDLPPTTPGYIPWPEDQSWCTPDPLFDFLHRHFKFTIDVAASKDNAKVKRFYDLSQNGLERSWKGETVWCNPPFSDAAKWLEKASKEAGRDTTVVALVPNRSATRWYREFIAPSALVVQLYGRIPFYRNDTGQHIEMSGAPFATILAIWPRSAGNRLLKFTQPVNAVLMELPQMSPTKLRLK